MNSRLCNKLTVFSCMCFIFPYVCHGRETVHDAELLTGDGVGSAGETNPQTCCKVGEGLCFVGM